MSLVASTIAEWLKNGALFALEEDDAIKAAWGDLAVESEILSCLALAEDAVEEGARQIAFLGHPMALESIRIQGWRNDLAGHAQKIVCDRAGYITAPSVFVLQAAEQDDGSTILAVLRRMDV